jgi:hypothetical protein
MEHSAADGNLGKLERDGAGMSVGRPVRQF